jgi:chromosome segregation ATPase
MNLFGNPATKLKSFDLSLEKAIDLEKEFKILCKLANEIFAKNFETHYKFTYEDLKFELMQKNIDNNKKKKLAKICDLFSELEFDKLKITKERLADISFRLSDVTGQKITDIRVEVLPDDIFRPQEMPAASIPEDEELPSFSTDVHKDLSSLLEDLNKNKAEIDDEIREIESEKSTLAKEKKNNLPEFKLFNKKLDDEIAELESKKESLRKRESLVDEKLVTLRNLESELADYSERLKKETINVKEKEDFILSKEKIISEIRNDFKEKYEDTLKEIEAIKADLKEKEDNFLAMQKFYQKREDKLNMEEGNLLEEKRKYGKAVKSLVETHLEIAKKDLENIEKQVMACKKRDSQIDSSLKDFVRKMRRLIAEKDLLKKTLDNKKKYFSSLEKDFRDKDDEFGRMAKEIETRQEKSVKLEKRLTDFEANIESAAHEARKKEQDIEMKELDLRVIEKDIRRLHFELKNHKMRLDQREKHLTKRIENFEALRKDIKNNIGREKRAVDRLTQRLQSKGYKVARELNELEKKEYVVNQEAGAMYNNSRKEDYIEREIKISHLPEIKLSNPNVLYILRLINISKGIVGSEPNDKSRDAYNEIQRLFNELDDEEKDSIYGNITEVFKMKDSGDITQKIDSMIMDFNKAVENGDFETSGNIYSRLQQKYLSLPKEDKSKYYDKIMNIYGKAQVATVGY